MPSRTRLAACLLILLIGAPWKSSRGSESDFAFYHENVLGTSLELRVAPETERLPRPPKSACFAISIDWPPSSMATTPRASFPAGKNAARRRETSRPSYSKSSRLRFVDPEERTGLSTREPRP